MRTGGWIVACALLVGAQAACAAPAAAENPLGGPGQKPGNPFCLKPGERTVEVYGPTDIGGTLGNGRLSVAVNPRGTLSVMRWPSPSFYDQLKYFTTDRGQPRLGLAPNEGVFSGLHLWLAGGRQKTVWLRDLELHQRFASEDSDTVVTRYRSRRLGLVLEIDDVVPQGADVLMRRHVLRLSRRSPVRRARLIAFADLNPVASQRPYVPTHDWCAAAGAGLLRRRRGPGGRDRPAPALPPPRSRARGPRQAVELPALARASSAAAACAPTGPSARQARADLPPPGDLRACGAPGQQGRDRRLHRHPESLRGGLDTRRLVPQRDARHDRPPGARRAPRLLLRRRPAQARAGSAPGIAAVRVHAAHSGRQLVHDELRRRPGRRHLQLGDRRGRARAMDPVAPLPAPACDAPRLPP